MYEESRSRIGGAIRWRSSASASPTRVLPDGCLDLLWWGDALVVAGPDTTAHVAASTGGITGLRFAPGVGPRVFGVPADELRDRRVPLDALWSSAEVRRLNDRVATSVDPREALEQIVVQQLAGRPSDPMSTAIARCLAGGASVSEVAGTVGLSERQLHRRSLQAFGYGPKMLARILRLGRVLALARAGIPAAECAIRGGFADQGHLARDVRALTGTTLTVLLG